MYIIASSSATLIPFNAQPTNQQTPAPQASLRPYQADVISEIEKAVEAGERRIILCANRLRQDDHRR
jgi:hypothetical protein